MSNELDKFKASSRRFKDEVNIAKQAGIAKQYGIFSGIIEKEPHRMVKKRVMNCGNPKCIMCMNPRHNKHFKKSEQLTIQEKRLFQRLFQQLDE